VIELYVHNYLTAPAEAVRLTKEMCIEEKREKPKKRWSDVIESDMKRAGVDYAGDRVKWKLRTRMADMK